MSANSLRRCASSIGEELLQYAKNKKNVLEYEEINDFFADLEIDANQMEKIYDYLEKHNVDVLLHNPLQGREIILLHCLFILYLKAVLLYPHHGVRKFPAPLRFVHRRGKLRREQLCRLRLLLPALKPVDDPCRVDIPGFPIFLKRKRGNLPVKLLRKILRRDNALHPLERLNEMAKLLLQFPEELERNNYTEALAQKYMISFDSLRKLVNRLGVQLEPSRVAAQTVEREREEGRRRSRPEEGMKKSQRLLLTRLIEEPQAFERVKGIITPEDFTEATALSVSHEISPYFRPYKLHPPVPPLSRPVRL